MKELAHCCGIVCLALHRSEILFGLLFFSLLFSSQIGHPCSYQFLRPCPWVLSCIGGWAGIRYTSTSVSTLPPSAMMRWLIALAWGNAARLTAVGVLWSFSYAIEHEIGQEQHIPMF